jgi:hypothetical protein
MLVSLSCVRAPCPGSDLKVAGAKAHSGTLKPQVIENNCNKAVK